MMYTGPPSVPLDPPPESLPEACSGDCPGVPTRRLFGPNPGRHYHHACWMCGAGLCSDSPFGYSCKSCAVSQERGAQPKPCPDFDPDLAANSPSP